MILASTYPSDRSTPSARHRRQSRRRFISILHILSLLASLIAVSLFAAAILSWNRNFFHNTGPNKGDWTDGVPIAPLSLAALYHAMVLIHVQLQRFRKSDVSTPSGASLGRIPLILHMIVPGLVLLSLFPALLLAAYGSLFRFWQPAVRTRSGILVCNTLNLFTRECEPTLYNIGSLQIAAIVFASLVGILHFALLLVSIRTLRRSMLAKQLQKEKMAQYTRREHRSSRERRRGYDNRRRPTDNHGAEDQTARHQNPPADRYRRTGSSSSSNSESESALSSGPGSHSLVGGSIGVQLIRDNSLAQQQRHSQQEVPIVFIQAPEESHAPRSTRHR